MHGHFIPEWDRPHNDDEGGNVSTVCNFTSYQLFHIQISMWWSTAPKHKKMSHTKEECVWVMLLSQASWLVNWNIDFLYGSKEPAVSCYLLLLLLLFLFHSLRNITKVRAAQKYSCPCSHTPIVDSNAHLLPHPHPPSPPPPPSAPAPTHPVGRQLIPIASW